MIYKINNLGIGDSIWTDECIEYIVTDLNKNKIRIMGDSDSQELEVDFTIAELNKLVELGSYDKYLKYKEDLLKQEEIEKSKKETVYDLIENKNLNINELSSFERHNIGRYITMRYDTNNSNNDNCEYIVNIVECIDKESNDTVLKIENIDLYTEENIDKINNRKERHKDLIIETLKEIFKSDKLKVYINEVYSNSILGRRKVLDEQYIKITDIESIDTNTDCIVCKAFILNRETQINLRLKIDRDVSDTEKTSAVAWRKNMISIDISSLNYCYITEKAMISKRVLKKKLEEIFKDKQYNEWISYDYQAILDNIVIPSVFRKRGLGDFNETIYNKANIYKRLYLHKDNSGFDAEHPILNENKNICEVGDCVKCRFSQSGFDSISHADLKDVSIICNHRPFIIDGKKKFIDSMTVFDILNELDKMVEAELNKK